VLLPVKAWAQRKRIKVAAWVLNLFIPWLYRAAKRSTVAKETAGAMSARPKLRLSICQTCPHFTKIDTCDQCHCYMPAKVQFEKAKCPKGLW